MAKALLLEHRSCGRCAGSGRFGPTCVYSGICFSCNGKGNVLTKRGRAAQAFLNNLRMRRADEFKVGDLILAEGFSAGSASAPSAWLRIESVEIKPGGYISGADAYEIKAKPLNPGPGYYENGMLFCGQASTLYRKGFSAAEKKEQREAALAFQATLGVNGKPKLKLVKEAA